MATNSFYAISTPAIVVDNTNISIVPNTAAYKEGFGEQQVRAQSNGGGSVSLVVARDITTALGFFTCQVENTAENIRFFRAIKAALTPHVVAWFDNTVGYSRTLEQAVMTNDPDIGLGADTPFTVEFKGAQTV